MEHGFGAAGDYGADSVYQAGTAAGSTENEYAYVWETLPDDAAGTGRRLVDYGDPTLPQHAPHCPQKPSRGPPYASRQTSLAPPSEYETTTTAAAQTGIAVGRAVIEQNMDDNKQFM